MIREAQVRIVRGFARNVETLLDYLVQDAEDTVNKGRAMAARDHVQESIRELKAIDAEEVDA